MEGSFNKMVHHTEESYSEEGRTEEDRTEEGRTEEACPKESVDTQNDWVIPTNVLVKILSRYIEVHA